MSVEEKRQAQMVLAGRIVDILQNVGKHPMVSRSFEVWQCSFLLYAITILAVLLVKYTKYHPLS